MKNLLTVIIPSRPNVNNLRTILKSLDRQTFQNFQIIILLDKILKAQEFDEIIQQTTDGLKNIVKKINFVCNLNSNFQANKGVSYVRNFGIKMVDTEFIILFDDDNVFDTNYLSKVINLYEKWTKKYQKDVVIVPTLMWRDSGTIQNQGFSGYNYWQARPIIHFLYDKQEFGEIKMFSGNGIFGKTEIMQRTLYDENFARIAEDLDFVYRIWKMGVLILVFKDLQIFHFERDKTILEKFWIGNFDSAKQKVKNIFLWVKKHGNFWEKLIFLARSSWGICGRLSIKALLYGKGEKWSITQGIWKGYIKGMKVFFEKK